MFAEPNNLDVAKSELKSYVASGNYELDQWQAVSRAISYLKHHQVSEKSAIVFDVDETLLSNYQDMLEYNFGGNAGVFVATEKKSHAKAILATKELFNLAKEKGLSIFILTGRATSGKPYVVKNLRREGLTGFKQLIMWPAIKPKTIAQYKSDARCKIVSKGYEILINVGDQASDFAGPCRGTITVKLPNPFYLLSANHVKLVKGRVAGR